MSGHAQQGALPAENSGGSDDRKNRLGSARRAGRSGFRPAGAGATSSTFIPNPRRRRSTGRNTPTGNARMKFFHITAFGSRNLRGVAAASARRGLCAAGFSLLEMMIVITIILILAGIAAARYERSVLRAREATLKQDLFIMRNAIQQYTLDKEAGPSSLDDLVPGNICPSIPTDPITRQQGLAHGIRAGPARPAADLAGDYRRSFQLPIRSLRSRIRRTTPGKRNCPW